MAFSFAGRGPEPLKQFSECRSRPVITKLSVMSQNIRPSTMTVKSWSVIATHLLLDGIALRSHYAVPTRLGTKRMVHEWRANSPTILAPPELIAWKTLTSAVVLPDPSPDKSHYRNVARAKGMRLLVTLSGGRGTVPIERRHEVLRDGVSVTTLDIRPLQHECDLTLTQQGN